MGAGGGVERSLRAKSMFRFKELLALQVRVGDTIEVPEKNRKIPVLAEAQEVIARRGCPAWLEADGAAFKGTVKALPQRDDIQFPVNEQLIVELYSK